MAKINIRESLGRIDLLTDNKYDLRNTYDSSNISNDKKKKLAESISKNASAKQLYSILNESFEEPGVNVTEKISDDVRDGMFGGLIGKDTEWEVFFESGPTDILDSDIEDMANDILSGRLSGRTNNGVGWQIRVGYNDDFYDYNCLNCPEDDYVGSRWEEYDESLNEEDNFNSDEYERKHILRLAKAVEEASKGADERKLSNLKKTAKKYLTNHKGTKHEKEYAVLQKAYDSLLDEDWEPDEWEETDFLDNEGKKVYINIIKEAEDIDDLKDIAHDLYWHDKGLFAMLRNFPKDKSFEWIQNRMIEVIESTMNESLTEAIKDVNSLHSKIWNMDNNEKICFPNGYCVKCEFYDREGKAKRYIVTDKKDNVIIKGKFGFAWQPQIKKFEEDFFNLLNGRSVDEALTEANYGGAYDIDPEMFWTKDDLIEFSDAVCEKLADKFGYQYDIADVGAESNNDMYITIMDTTHDIEADVSFRIKMSRIRAPRDLMKYLDTVVSQFVKKFEEEYQYYDFDESLNEDVDDEEIDLDVETDFGDGSVEEGDTFIEDGREWSWIERIAGPIHLDFDNWAVWSARDWDYIQEKIRPILLNKEELTVETLTKIYDEAEVAYFVVDEDTGFIDWGPVESQTEAQDFLNGKVEDWENDEEYDESLKENKNLKESWTIELEYEYETYDGYDTYTYEADGDDVVDYITDRMYGDGEYPDFLEGQSDEEIEDWLSKKENYQKFKDWVEENIDDLLKRYEDDVYEHFREQSEMEYYDELNDYDDWKLNNWSRYDNGSGMTDRDFL